MKKFGLQKNTLLSIRAILKLDSIIYEQLNKINYGNN